LSVHFDIIRYMRELLPQDSAPSLFDAPPPASYLHAKDFVRWCCGFGTDFRNSPDVTNLRFWARKNKIKIQDSEETEILETARPMFLKRIEQAVRKLEKLQSAETPN
jgi:hypothetical protein